MKQKGKSQELVTKGYLKEELGILETRINIKFDKLKREIDDNAQKYRDQVLTKIDGVMGQLETLREDSLIGAHQTRELRKQVDDHEKRLVQLEKVPEAA